MKKIKINVQNLCKKKYLIPYKKIKTWINSLKYLIIKHYELTIRLVDIQESKKLNLKYRKKNFPTNILSFTYNIPFNLTNKIIGDLVICVPLLQIEAIKQNKNIIHHWAHIIIHGFLHLIGFNHSSNKETIIMKLMEKKILEDLGFNI